MPDGRRKRRYSANSARRRWYAEHRSRRFSRRFGWTSVCAASSRPIRKSRDLASDLAS
jgi:hypothetical protein